MRKLLLINNNPKCTLWDGMWSTRTIKQEFDATGIETSPRVMLLKYLNKDHKIIDAGCGFGKWVIFLAKQGYNIIGVDNNDLAIAKLKSFDNSLQIEPGNILKFKYPDNYFDAYISMGVVEHFEDGPLLALEEAYRILKPNGLIFLSTPTVNLIRKIVIQPILNVISRFYYIFSRIKFFIENPRIKPHIFKKNSNKQGNNNKHKKYVHFLEYRFTKNELQTFLRQSNFEVIETHPHDFHGSKDHHIGLGVDFPFLKDKYGVNFKLNFVGKKISRLLDSISPWIACASVLCVARSLKEIV